MKMNIKGINNLYSTNPMEDPDGSKRPPEFLEIWIRPTKSTTLVVSATIKLKMQFVIFANEWPIIVFVYTIKIYSNEAFHLVFADWLIDIAKSFGFS